MENVWMLVALLSLVGGLYGLFVGLFRKGRRKQGWKIAGGSVFVFFVSAFFFSSSSDRIAREAGFESAEEMRAAEAAEREQAAAAAAEEEVRLAAQEAAREAEAEAEKRRKGFHCLSAWDGSHSDFKRAVKQSMRDPDSFEHIETRVTPVNDEGFHVLSMAYRARNGFGGMNVGEAIALIRSEDCVYEVVSVE